MKKPSETIAEKLYAHLAPEERERALYNLNRYFEIVLGIFLRLERERKEKTERASSAFDEGARAS